MQLLWRWREKAQALGHRRRLGTAFDPHLGQDIGDVGSRRLRADKEGGGDLPVRESARDQPKNLTLTVAAAITIAQAELSTASAAFVLVFFVLLGSLSIAVPIALYFLGGPSAARALDGLRTWLSANNATVMAVLLLVIGVVLFGKGLGNGVRAACSLAA